MKHPRTQWTLGVCCLNGGKATEPREPKPSTGNEKFTRAPRNQHLSPLLSLSHYLPLGLVSRPGSIILLASVLAFPTSQLLMGCSKTERNNRILEGGGGARENDGGFIWKRGELIHKRSNPHSHTPVLSVVCRVPCRLCRLCRETLRFNALALKSYIYDSSRGFKT